jgi:hypothetical protein
MKRKKSKSAAPKPAPPPPSAILAGFYPLEQYQASRVAIFPTIHTLRWIIAEHREELLEADALRQHRGRLMLHAERADRVVDKLGRDAAIRRFGGIRDEMLTDAPRETA